MKNLFKSRLFIVLVTVLICISGTVVATSLYNANRVSYTPNDENIDIDNVKDALDDLYENNTNSNELTISGTSTWKNLSDNGISNPVLIYPEQLYLFNSAIDLTKYKYLVLIYGKYQYYTSTIGMGVINKANASLSECQSITTKNTNSWTGNKVDKDIISIMYLDVSDLSGDYYPFMYYSSPTYSRYLYYYLTTDENIPSL